MKTIQPVSIWSNGVTKQATLLNAYAISVVLDSNATFYYSLLAENQDGTVGEVLSQGNLSMDSDAYAEWEQDEAAWDFIASTLNLTITGDYVENNQ